MENLSKIQKIIWNIMDEIKPFLNDNNIEYYMLGGTLLGAVRHQGFIPWDDDIDLGIPREQYDLFLEKVAQQLPDYMEVNTFYDETSHHYYFSRIVDTRYHLKRMGSEIERTEDAWIDIFPLDGMPNNLLLRQWHKFRLLSARAFYHIATFDRVNLQRPNRPLSERIIIKFVQLTGFGRNSDEKKWLWKIDKLLKKYPYKDSEWVVNFMGQYKFKEMFPKEKYGKGKLYPFENDYLNGPEDADCILTQMYGDYMTPPKESEKNAHAAQLEV